MVECICFWADCLPIAQPSWFWTVHWKLARDPVAWSYVNKLNYLWRFDSIFAVSVCRVREDTVWRAQCICDNLKWFSRLAKWKEAQAIKLSCQEWATIFCWTFDAFFLFPWCIYSERNIVGYKAVSRSTNKLTMKLSIAQWKSSLSNVCEHIHFLEAKVFCSLQST